MSDSADRKITLLSAVAIGVYFFWFAGPGLFTDFMPDDLMNLARAREWSLGQLLRDTVIWFLPSPTYRPFGAVWYSFIYEFSGLWMLPARVAAYTLLVASFWLLWRVARLSRASEETATLAVLIWSYHYSFFALYYNNGTVYDILCTFFVLAILVLYAEWRQRGEEVTWKRTGALAFVYICALGSKEVAIAVPPLLVTWELIVLRTWRFPYRAVAVLGAMSLPWFYTRVIDKSMLTTMSAYQPEYSWQQFNRTFHSYMAELFNRYMALDPGYSYTIVLLTVCLALRFRDRTMQFALALWFLAYLPLAFVGPRSPYAIHLCTSGLALALAGAVVDMTRAAFAGRLDLLRRCTVFGLTMWGLIAFNTRPNLINLGWMNAEARAIRGYWKELDRAQLHPPREGKILLLNDPLKQWDWACTFASQLYYHDPRLMVISDGKRDEHFKTYEWVQVWRWNGGSLECAKCGSAAGPAK